MCCWLAHTVNVQDGDVIIQAGKDGAHLGFQVGKDTILLDKIPEGKYVSIPDASEFVSVRKGALWKGAHGAHVRAHITELARRKTMHGIP